MRITLEFPFVVDHLKVQQQVRDELLRELGAKLTAAELEGLDLSAIIASRTASVIAGLTRHWATSVTSAEGAEPRACLVVIFKTDIVDATVMRS